MGVRDLVATSATQFFGVRGLKNLFDSSVWSAFVSSHFLSLSLSSLFLSLSLFLSRFLYTRTHGDSATGWPQS